MEQNTTVTAATWARTICLLVALLNSLLTAFGSIDAIRKASPEELTRVEGIRPVDAENIRNFFQ